MDDQTEFKIRDAASYDSLAGEFDRLTQCYTQYAVDPLLDAAGAGDARCLVDLGCGTGIVALAAAARHGPPAARVIGVDLSDGMLEVARKKAGTMAHSRALEFRKGDAEALDLDGGSVDAVVSLYAFRHFPDPAKAAAECLRVLRPGGRFAAAVGSGPAMFSVEGLRAVLALGRRRLAGWLGREREACAHLDALVERHLGAPRSEEIASWSAGHAEFSAPLASLVREAGFSDVSTVWHGREYKIESAEEFWALQATFSSLARKRIAGSEPEAVARLRLAFHEDCEAVLGRGGRLVYRVGAALVTGTKAG